MPPRNFTDAEEEQIARIYLAGHSTRAIARAYKLHDKTSIIGALRRQNITQRSPAERNRLYRIDAHAFDVIDTEEKAYWWGFIYADGNVYRRSLSVALKSTDENHLAKLKAFLKSEHPIKIIKVGCGNSKRFGVAVYYATDSHLVDRLRELGITPRRKNFNRVIANLPNELSRHWIRGFFDGDGTAGHPHASRGPYIGFCGSVQLLEWVRKTIADNANTNPNLSIHRHIKSKICYLTFSGNVVAHNVTSWLYQDAEIWLTRKKKKVDSWPPPMENPYLRERDEKGRFI